MKGYLLQTDKIKLGLTISLILLIVLYLGGATIFNGEPEVMMSEVEPMFVSQCVSQSNQTPLDRNGEIAVSVWNIYKQQKPQWKAQLQELTDHSDLVLLQEARLNSGFSTYLAQSQRHVVMAKGFKLLNVPMGVMNISTEQVGDACAYQTIEPWIRFAKSTLITSYPLSTGQQLLVINLHGLNFDWKLDRFQAQWQRVLQKVAIHQGPVIVGGDFNTWRDGRVKLVRELTERLKLKEVKYHVDHRHRVFGLPLDHLYYKGLILIDASSTQTNGSDHNPIWAKFMVEPVLN